MGVPLVVNFHLQEIWGGQPKYADMLSRELVERGVSTLCITGRPMPEWGPAPYPVISVPTVPDREQQPYEVLPKELLWDHADYCAMQAWPHVRGAVAAHIGSADGVILHGHSLDGALVAARIERRLQSAGVPMQVRLAATVHSLGIEKIRAMSVRSSPPLVNQLRRRLLLEAQHYTRAGCSGGVVVATNFARDLLAKETDLPLPSITVCPPGVDHQLFHPRRAPDELEQFRNDFSVPAHAQVILSSGRMDSTKNHETALRAFARIRKDCPSAYLLILGGGSNGEDHAYRRGLESLAAMLCVGDHVRIRSGIPHEAMPAVYRSVDVLVVPEWFGHWNMTVSEALACGTSVVASCHTGAARDGARMQAVVIVDPEDVDDVANAMKHVLCDDTVRDRLARQAIAYARKLTWSRAVDVLLGQLREAGSAPPAGG